ncbi:MAG TPA: CoA transferase [Candidatus Dormibacteraeota bacterium]|nr:CoA transferase [Candidatus Dormibacteraeota bacterium]
MLDGVRVLELAACADAAPAAAYCARTLADLGADVIKIEPPEGDPLRGTPPFVDGVPGPDRGLTWIALNANKRGVVLDRSSRDGERRFRALVERSDAVITADPSLDRSRLEAWNERAIVSIVTPFGASGPLAAARASDLEVTAASGSLWLAGEPGEAPVRTTLPQAWSWTGMYAAAGTLLALLARERIGTGQTVDTSGQASMATVHPPACVFWDVMREEHVRLGAHLLGRSIVGARFRNVWPCADGHVAFAIQGGPIGRHTMRELVSWMRERGVVAPRLDAVDWDRFDNRTLTQDEVDALEAEVGTFLRTLTKREFFAGVVARNMLGYPASAAPDVYADEQLRAREFWQRVPVPAAGCELPFPGGFATFDGERPPIRRPPPRLGEHDAEIFAEIEARVR